MNSKLFNIGICLMAAAASLTLIAIIMEIQTGEPVYYLVMKIAACLFGVGGTLFGIGIVRRRNRTESDAEVDSGAER
ncbi:hypothetical protein ES703_117262 [subsurface metagenome]